MTQTVNPLRSSNSPRPWHAPDVTPPTPQPGLLAAFASIVLLLAAIAPLDRVFADRAWLAPGVSAAVLSFFLAFVVRRMNFGALISVIFSVLSWALFSGLALLPETLAGGILPTADTLTSGINTWTHGIELLRLRPTPAVAETGLVFITITGIWAVGHSVHELVFRLHAPLRAALIALVLWIVPLGLSPKVQHAWLWAVPLLVATALLLLASSGPDAARWGRWSPGVERRGLWRHASPLGWALASVAVAGGVLLAPLLPGWTDPALYELRDLGGSTITTNPIVSIRASLLSPDPRPVLQVRTVRPFYTRITSLDIYSDREEWTNGGIRGTPYRAGSTVAYEVPIAFSEPVFADLEVAGLRDAVLMPLPYQPRSVDGTMAEALQYDRDLSTFTLNRGVRLGPGDRYAVHAAIPNPSAADLERVPSGWYQGPLVALPASTPNEVGALARDIVDAADARTPFHMAFAIQDALRQWTYSLDPPSGHGGEAMRTFLRNRIGYCEQFAGTMAVMLRTLGVPSRVAVGFTPGELTDAETNEYLVRSSNAHAWVEVLFPEMGWIAFEPTPRRDGNVLVPTASNLAPSTTEAQRAAELAEDLGPDPLPDETAGGPTPSASPTAVPTPNSGAGGAGVPGMIALIVVLLAGLVGIGSALLRRGRTDVAALLPSGQVLHALAHVEAIAAALGSPRRVSETDREFLARITRSQAGSTLALHAEQARYAAAMPAEAVQVARESAQELVQRMLQPLDRRSRWRITFRVRSRELRNMVRNGLPKGLRREWWRRA